MLRIRMHQVCVLHVITYEWHVENGKATTPGGDDVFCRKNNISHSIFSEKNTIFAKIFQIIPV